MYIFHIKWGRRHVLTIMIFVAPAKHHLGIIYDNLPNKFEQNRGCYEKKPEIIQMQCLFPKCSIQVLLQLWTMYCESAAAQYPVYNESHKMASNMVMDFWGRVTPGILQMLSTSKEVCGGGGGGGGGRVTPGILQMLSTSKEVW